MVEDLTRIRWALLSPSSMLVNKNLYSSTILIFPNRLFMHAFMFSKRGDPKKWKGYQGTVAYCLSEKAPSQGGAFSVE